MYYLSAKRNLEPMKWENIKSALTILWQGFLAIFIVIALIILAVTLINLCVSKAEAAKRKKDAEKRENRDGEES